MANEIHCENCLDTMRRMDPDYAEIARLRVASVTFMEQMQLFADEPIHR